MVGYPEETKPDMFSESQEYYNSVIVVSREGETIANYRKSILYFGEDEYSIGGPDDVMDGVIPRLGNVTMGNFKLLTKSQESEHFRCLNFRSLN